MNGPDKKRFEAIFAEGRRARGKLVTVVSLPGSGLLGFATSKKIGTKPRRTRALRRFREAIRLQSQIRSNEFDFVVIVSVEGANAPFERIQEEVRQLFGQAIGRWAEESESC